MHWGKVRLAAATLLLAALQLSCAGQPPQKAGRGTLLLQGGDDIGPEFIAHLAAALRPGTDLCLITSDGPSR